MAVNQIFRTGQLPSLLGGLQWLVYQIFSFETLLVMFLFGVRLQALLPRPPIPETVLYGVISVVVGLWIILRQGIYVRGIPIVVAGLVFTAWMVASYSWTPSHVLARESLPFILGVNIWALIAAACIVAGSRERTLRLLLLIMVLGTVLSAIGCYIYFIEGDFRFYRGAAGDWHHRTSLDWGNIAALGASVALALIIYTRFGSCKQIIALMIFGCCSYFLLIAGARGAILGPILAGLFAMFVSMPHISEGRIQWPKAQLLVMLTIIGASTYVAYLFMTGQNTSTLGRFMKLFEQAEDTLLRAGPNRFDYLAGAYRAWLDAPFFGQGLQGFSLYFCGIEDPGCHPHNIFMQSLADFGLIGFVFLVFFTYVSIRNINLLRLRQDPLLIALVMLVLTIGVYAMVHANLPIDHRVYFFIGLLALRIEAPDHNGDADR